MAKETRKEELKSFINHCSIEAQKNIGSSDFNIWEERREEAEKEMSKLVFGKLCQTKKK